MSDTFTTDAEFTLDVVQAAEIKYAVVRNGGNNADLKALSSEDMFAKILPILRGYGKVVVELFQHLGEVAFPGATNFVASEHFIKDTSVSTKVKISGFGSNFSAWFLGKGETQVAPTIRYDKLLQWAKATVILAFLGGEVPAEMSLAEILHLTSLQPNGEAGALLVNEWANIFFVRDVNGVLRLVRVHWDGDGWSFYAYETSDVSEWDADDQVFSRKAA